jgi:hypothetical protein
MRITIV